MFDESSITGESEPIFKKVGDEVLSGVICTDSIIRFKAIRKSDESMLQNIIHLLSDAVTKKPKIEQLANIISGYFSVAILSIAILTFYIGWCKLF